ncbi:hypothetical protein P8452_70428 [Trifolium repens]|nr:hypothetical protein P8452_70428 [Trifolium repens]
MENNKNGSSKPMLQCNDPQSDGATDIGPTTGEGTSTRNIKMLPVSYSDLDSGCLGPLKREIGIIINNQKIKCCEDEKDDASKLKDVVECVKINVRYFNGSKFSVQVALESTVESFKELIVGNSGIPIQNQRLFYKGKILQNDQSLQSYGLGANHTVHLVHCFAPTDTDDGIGNSDTGTMTYDVADAEWDDELLREELPPHLVNPDIMWVMLTDNEELPPNGVIDPNIVSQVLEAARNPAIMHEMTRLSDLELNNIVSSPNGFNMLRHIYEEIQEPNASIVAGNGITGISGTYDGNASSSLPNTTPLPNPWAFTEPNASIVAGNGITGISGTYDGNASSSLPNTTPLPNPWAPLPNPWASLPNLWAPIPNFWGFIENDWDYNGRSTTGFSAVEGILDGSFMPNDALQDPPTPEFIEFIPSNEEALCQFDGRNIEQHGMPDLSSLREEIQNPEYLSLSFQPETLQQPLSFSEEDLPPELSQQQSVQEPDQTTGDTVTAEQLYACQLSHLQQMGFNDREENIRALILTSGDILAAIRHLWWLLHQ